MNESQKYRACDADTRPQRIRTAYLGFHSTSTEYVSENDGIARSWIVFGTTPA